MSAVSQLARNQSAYGNLSLNFNQVLTGATFVTNDASHNVIVNPVPTLAPIVTSSANAAGTPRVLTLDGAWNKVKNVAVRHDVTDEAITIKDFVHVDLLTSSASDVITIVNAKRGVIETGGGNDRIDLQAFSDWAGAGNTFRIDTGIGQDTLNLNGYRGWTSFSIATGANSDVVSVTSYSRTVIDGGEMNDRITLDLSGLAWVAGGVGDDTLTLRVATGALEVARVSGGFIVRLSGNAASATEFTGIEHLGLSDRAVEIAALTTALSGTALNTYVSLAAIIAGGGGGGGGDPDPDPNPDPDPEPPPTQTDAAPYLPPTKAGIVQGTPTASVKVGYTVINVAANATVSGSSANEQFALANRSIAYGGAGDDTYNVAYSNNRTIELPGGGIDTLVSYQGWMITTPDNVENITLKGSATVSAAGNELSNIIIGNDGDNFIDGRGNRDLLTGGKGKDVFAYGRGSGNDTITDFTPGTDRIFLGQSDFGTWAKVRAALTQVGDDVVFRLSATDSLTFAKMTVAELGSRDFELPVDASSYRLTFEDNFDSWEWFNGRNADTDGGYWRTRFYHGTGETNHPYELQSYVNPYWNDLGVNPFSVANGVLTITASRASEEVRALADDRPYVSGVITTQGTFAQQYGYFEAKVKLPGGAGMFPAFWLLPSDQSWPPEIDIFEVVGTQPSQVFQMGTYVNDFVDTTDGFHVYSLEWREDRVNWFIDGVMTRSVVNTEYHLPMYILLNLAVASGWAGAPSEASGGVQDLPKQMQIDYVRAWAARPDEPVGGSAPKVTFSDEQIAVGETPRDAFTYVSTYDGPITFLPDDIGLPAADYIALHVVSDRTADSYSVRQVNGWGSIRNVKITDSDGGTIYVSDFSLSEVILGGTKNSTVTVLNPQNALIQTGSGNDTISVPGQKGWDQSVGSEVKVLSGAGNDSITGWTTGGGMMRIDAGTGNDTIIASGGDDWIIAGAGNDRITTRGGDDTVVFRAGDEGSDTITDFDPANDVIRFQSVSRASVTLTSTADGAVIRWGTGGVIDIDSLGGAKIASLDFVFA